MYLQSQGKKQTALGAGLRVLSDPAGWRGKRGPSSWSRASAGSGKGPCIFGMDFLERTHGTHCASSVGFSLCCSGGHFIAAKLNRQKLSVTVLVWKLFSVLVLGTFRDRT